MHIAKSVCGKPIFQCWEEKNKSGMVRNRFEKDQFLSMNSDFITLVNIFELVLIIQFFYFYFWSKKLTKKK